MACGTNRPNSLALTLRVHFQLKELQSRSQATEIPPLLAGLMTIMRPTAAMGRGLDGDLSTCPGWGASKPKHSATDFGGTPLKAILSRFSMVEKLFWAVAPTELSFGARGG